MGIDFIQQHTLNYSEGPILLSLERRSFLAFRLNETLQPRDHLSVVQIKVNLTTEAGCSQKSDSVCILNVAVPDIPALTGSPALIQPDQSGQAFLHIVNCSPNYITLQRGELIGCIENVTACEKRQINPSYINEIASNNSKKCAPIPLTKEKKPFLRKSEIKYA